MKATCLKIAGSWTAHSMAWKPPIDEPTRRSTAAMPKALRTSIVAWMISRTVTFGKSSRYGRPVAGLTEAGEVDP